MAAIVARSTQVAKKRFGGLRIEAYAGTVKITVAGPGALHLVTS